ncbi:MAG TPA: glycine cleavage system protein H [Draconibacterium sp.]|nr:glycine cleavage system protein H [Draconibacterium sp.]
MEGYTYTNIFETKGIEYLVIIAFFAILVPFWLMLNRKTKVSKLVSKTSGIISINSIRIPQGIFFSKNHTWAHLETNGEAKVGIDDLLFHITGNVRVENIKNQGEFVRKGDLMTRIIHNGKKLNVFSPISGEITATNTMIIDNPEQIKDDPLKQLWIYNIKPANWKAETNSYYLADEATIWMLQELTRIKDFLSAAVAKYIPEPTGIVLQDGGELLDQPLTDMPEEVWNDFQLEFLS